MVAPSSSQTMASIVSQIAPRMPFASPDKRGPMPIPALYGISEPLLENGLQFALKPGVQDGIGALLHCFRTYLPGRGSEQCEQFGGFPSEVLVGPVSRLAFGLPGGAGLRDTLIGTALVFTPQL